LIAFFVCLLYFQGYVKPGYHPLYNHPSPGLAALLSTSLELLTSSLGPKSADFWPYSGWIVLALILVSFGVLLSAWHRRPDKRFVLNGLLAYLAAMAILSLGLGWGRSGMGPGFGFTSRYVTLAIPILCLVYLVLELHAGTALARIGRLTLMGLTCASMVHGAPAYIARAKADRQIVEAMEQDLFAGMPISDFLKRYNGRSYVFPPPVDQPPVSNKMAQKHIEMLQRAGVGAFRYVRPEGAPREFAMPIRPETFHDMSWQGAAGQRNGQEPHLDYRLPRTAFVHAIRLTYAIDHAGNTAPVRVSWGRDDRPDPEAEKKRFIANVDATREQVTTIPVNDSISRYRIDLDSRTESIRISKIELILPPSPSVLR
jgi:hypothetical protein